MKYLFLGGPADGERRAVIDKPTVYIRLIPPVSFGADSNDLVALKTEDHAYTRRELTGGLSVYAHTSLPTHEILPRLLRGYSPDAL